MKTESKLINSKLSPAREFMISIRTFFPREEVTFYCKKSGRSLDTWEVFASGVRNFKEIMDGHPTIVYVAKG